MVVCFDDGVVSLPHAKLKGERKMKKRIFSLLLVIAMLVTVLPVDAFAAGCDHEALDYSHYAGSQQGAWCDSCR